MNTKLTENYRIHRLSLDSTNRTTQEEVLTEQRSVVMRHVNAVWVVVKIAYNTSVEMHTLKRVTCQSNWKLQFNFNHFNRRNFFYFR